MPTPSPRILYVDDDQDNCDLIAVMLRLSGADYEFTSVSSPDEGLKLAAARRFDLYLLDYRFAGKSGVDMCRILRRTDAVTPILFFTGEAREPHRRAAMEAGANAYLVKPDDLEKLTHTVQELLCARQTADAPGAARRGRYSDVSASSPAGHQGRHS